MKKITLTILGLLVLFSLAGCTLSLLGEPAPVALPSLTPNVSAGTPAATQTPFLPTETPVPASATAATATAASATDAAPAVPSPVAPGAPSGPYGVILVEPGDVLNIRSGAGAGNAVVGTFAAHATNVMRSGPSASVEGAQWVQVQNPSGGTGWVNSRFLSEYVSPAAFCADARVYTLLTALGGALTSPNGEALAALVSPAHGMDVRLWRYGSVVNYDREHARWVFDSTYVINWGADGASGLDTTGSFGDALLPKLQEVFNSSYTLGCNDPAVAAAFSTEPWPPEYGTLNYYRVMKPGTPGVDLDFRIWLVGVEFVQGQPYVFSLIHFQWEP